MDKTLSKCQSFHNLPTCHILFHGVFQSCYFVQNFLTYFLILATYYLWMTYSWFSRIRYSQNYFIYANPLLLFPNYFASLNINWIQNTIIIHTVATLKTLYNYLDDFLIPTLILSISQCFGLKNLRQHSVTEAWVNLFTQSVNSKEHVHTIAPQHNIISRKSPQRI